MSEFVKTKLGVEKLDWNLYSDLGCYEEMMMYLRFIYTEITKYLFVYLLSILGICFPNCIFTLHSSSKYRFVFPNLEIQKYSRRRDISLFTNREYTLFLNVELTSNKDSSLIHWMPFNKSIVQALWL